VEPPLVPDNAKAQANGDGPPTAAAGSAADAVPGGWAHVTACHFPVVPGESLATAGAAVKGELG
jgi:hypothetical protein